MSFYVERVSKRVWKLVDNDPYGQFAFIYFIDSIDKYIIIDTGTGHRDLLQFLKGEFSLNEDKRILIICTHIHFDHIGGIKHFKGYPKLMGIYMGSNNRTFSQNIEINSLAMGHHGATVAPFEVNRWLNEGDLIYLDDNNPVKDMSLEVIHTPGHTPDSIALFYRFGEKRLFVGDTIYPFTAIHVDCLGSNFNDYSNTITKLNEFCIKAKEEQMIEDNLPLSVGTVSNEQNMNIEEEKGSVGGQNEKLKNFCDILGLSTDNIINSFNFDSLLEMSDGSVESAINFYLTNMDSLGMIFPPKPSGQEQKVNTNSSSPYDLQFFTSNEINLSCGHVEANLSSTDLGKINYTLTLIKNGMLSPNFVDQGYGEYTNDNFTLLVPMKRN